MPWCGPRWVAVTSLLLLLLLGAGAEERRTKGPNTPHSRKERFLWVTHDGRLALPPGTHLEITPSLSLPFVRHPPDGFSSHLGIRLPFTIDFDELGLTDNANPYGALPPLLARSMGQMAGGAVSSYVASLIEARLRSKRGVETPAVKAPPEAKAALHGGERALLYQVAEDFLETMGMDGKACVLRAICEVHGQPLNHFGLVGEFLRLFFTASKSQVSDLLSEYVAAERAGQGDGECWHYHKDCPKSLFLWRSKYSEETHEEENAVRDEGLDPKSAGREKHHGAQYPTLLM